MPAFVRRFSYHQHQHCGKSTVPPLQSFIHSFPHSLPCARFLCVKEMPPPDAYKLFFCGTYDGVVAAGCHSHRHRHRARQRHLMPITLVAHSPSCVPVLPHSLAPLTPLTYRYTSLLVCCMYVHTVFGPAFHCLVYGLHLV